MIILDTDCLSIFEREKHLESTLRANLAHFDSEDISTTIITYEEQMRGWLASIAKERLAVRQVRSYTRLAQLFAFFADYEIATFDVAAAMLFGTFNRIRIGTMDLKIGAIAIAHDALLLTANRRDFEQIPGLRFENWLE